MCSLISVFYRSNVNFLDSIEYSEDLKDYNTDKFYSLSEKIMFAVSTLTCFMKCLSTVYRDDKFHPYFHSLHRVYIFSSQQNATRTLLNCIVAS